MLLRYNMTAPITHKQFFWLNLVWFQASWFIAIVYTQQAILVLTLSLVAHFCLSPTKRADLLNMLLISLIGGLADNLLTYIGIFNFPESGVIPLWLVLLWAHFAITLNHSMQWLVKLPTYLQVCFGAVFGTLSYYSGAQLDAVALPNSLVISLLAISLTWATLLPLYIKIAKHNR